MKKSLQSRRRRSNAEKPEKNNLQLQKAVAQAWLSRRQSLGPSSSSEFDTRRRNIHRSTPSRFKLEALGGKAKTAAIVCWDDDGRDSKSKWNFNQSLWDPYEIVAMSKRLEQGLLLGDNRFSVSDVMDEDWKKFVMNGVLKRRQLESKNSLRNLMRTMVHSKRFD